MVPERISWNRIYKQESLEDAYEKCFGQALRDYNASQKRKDRKKDNYLKEIENSGNKEKPLGDEREKQELFMKGRKEVDKVADRIRAGKERILERYRTSA